MQSSLTFDCSRSMGIKVMIIKIMMTIFMTKNNEDYDNDGFDTNNQKGRRWSRTTTTVQILLSFILLLGRRLMALVVGCQCIGCGVSGDNNDK